MKTPKRVYVSLGGDTEDYHRAQDENMRPLETQEQNLAAQADDCKVADELMCERECRMYLHAAYCRLARIYRSAIQNTSICTDAEQLTERKEQA